MLPVFAFPFAPPHALRRRLAAGLVGVVLALTSCVPAAPAPNSGRLRVVATTGMIADAARQIGGDHIELYSLMGPGVDPHLYKATAGDVRAIGAAELILFNGLHLEAAMGEVLEEMGRRTRTVAVGESVPDDQLIGSAVFGGTHDPHIWFDVTLWRHAVQAVADALAEADAARAPEYRARATAYLAELAALDEWVRAQMATIPPDRRVLITAHDAFGYFGRAYGVDVRGLQGISTAAEAGTADVQGLARLIAERRIPALFVETSIPRRTIEAVQAAARDRGATVEIGAPLYSDALGSSGTPAASYIGMVRSNVAAIVRGLGGAAVIARTSTMERTAA